VTSAEITDQSLIGDELTIASSILIETGAAGDADSAEVTWSVTEQVPEGLVIRDVTCAESAGTSCEVEFDETTNLVTVTGMIDEDAVGEPVEVRLEIETGVTVDFDRTSELDIQACVAGTSTLTEETCANDEASTEVTIDLEAAPSLGRLPAVERTSTPEADSETTPESMETAEADESTPTREASSELSIDVTSAEITDQSFLGDRLTIGSSILIETGAARGNEDSEVTWSVTEQVPEGLVIRDVTCVDPGGTSCEAEFDAATNLVTVTGTIEEDAVGEPVEVRLEIETGVTVDFDRTSDLEIETCVTDTSFSAATPTGDACAGDEAGTELTVELAATPSLGRLPATGLSPEPTGTDPAGVVPMVVAGALLLTIALGFVWRARHPPA